MPQDSISTGFADFPVVDGGGEIIADEVVAFGEFGRVRFPSADDAGDLDAIVFFEGVEPLVGEVVGEVFGHFRELVGMFRLAERVEGGSDQGAGEGGREGAVGFTEELELVAGAGPTKRKNSSPV